MPKLLTINGYQISIWSNENGEPIHVHISKKKPTLNSTKQWLLSDGTFLLANPNTCKIPKVELNKIIKRLLQQRQAIIDCWVAYQGYLTFYR